MYSSGECFKSEANSEPRQISKMDFFTKIVHSFSPLTIFQKSSISDVRLGSEYSAEDSKPLWTFSKNQAASYLLIKLLYP